MGTPEATRLKHTEVLTPENTSSVEDTGTVMLICTKVPVAEQGRGCVVVGGTRCHPCPTSPVLRMLAVPGCWLTKTVHINCRYLRCYARLLSRMLASSITSASTFSALSSQSRPGLPDAVGPSAEGLWVCAAYRQQAPAPKGAALLKRQLFEHSSSTYLNSVNDERNRACVMQTAEERALLTATDTGGNTAYSTRWGLHWKNTICEAMHIHGNIENSPRNLSSSATGLLKISEYKTQYSPQMSTHRLAQLVSCSEQVRAKAARAPCTALSAGESGQQMPAGASGLTRGAGSRGAASGTALCPVLRAEGQGKRRQERLSQIGASPGAWQQRQEHRAKHGARESCCKGKAAVNIIINTGPHNLRTQDINHGAADHGTQSHCQLHVRSVRACCYFSSIPHLINLLSKPVPKLYLIGKAYSANVDKAFLIDAIHFAGLEAISGKEKVKTAFLPASCACSEQNLVVLPSYQLSFRAGQQLLFVSSSASPAAAEETASEKGTGQLEVKPAEMS
ncbi:hypothetical protein Anapl_00191 [Anas platyrhynchos]|uniref:Uncharacterized protein n=1 Tax=Anas platyrhynchos TaxID=8839 RepID=R0K2D7_ANAPL|nr:hypothetical protein Anapl_00191 [Anas platyrhynchos]